MDVIPVANPFASLHFNSFLCPSYCSIPYNFCYISQSLMLPSPEQLAN